MAERANPRNGSGGPPTGTVPPSRGMSARVLIVPPRLARGVIAPAANDNPEPPGPRLMRFGWIALALALVILYALFTHR